VRTRVVAFAIAVALVAGAIVIRNRMNTQHTASSHPLTLVCSTELEAACTALPPSIHFTVEPAGTTAANLVSANPPAIDGWLVTGPWPEIVSEERAAKGESPLVTMGPALARSPLVTVAWPDRTAVIKKACPVALRCAGDVALAGAWEKVGGQPAWDPVKISMGDPQTDAVGLDALAAATAAFFGRADVSSTDLDGDAFRAWLSALAQAWRGDKLSDMVAVGPSVADLALSIEAVAKPLVGAAANKPDLLYPSTVVSADVVLGEFATARSTRLSTLIATSKVLTNTGWRAPVGTSTALPAAGLLDALRAAWKDAL
jgi:hypothetical protein